MYAVSDNYISSMSADLREMPSFSVVLYNADNSANANLSFSFDPEPLQRGEQLNSFKKVSTRAPRATLEHNWLRADGCYTTSNTGDYIGACLSSEMPNEDGLYVYDVADTITVSIASGSSKPLSFLLDAAISVVEIMHTDGTTEVVTLERNDSGNTLSVQDDGQGDISLRFLSSFCPLRRPRVYGIYAAQVFFWDCNDIVGIEFEDENDIMCLELPSRKAKLLINNLDGKMDPYKENTEPSFHRKETQALLVFFYNNESVPIGRLFLDTYTVDRDEITLSFDWAIMPLNDAKYSLSRIGDYSVQERLTELIDPDPQYIVRTIMGVEQNPTAVYWISVSMGLITSDIANKIVKNPYPICSRAECFQLLCNATGLLMRPARQDDIELLPPPRRVSRHIGYSELIGEPEYAYRDNAVGATIARYDLMEATSIAIDSRLIRSDQKTRIELDEPAMASSGWLQEIYDSSNNFIGLVEYAAQGYVAFVWCAMEHRDQFWSQNSGDFSLWIQKRKKSNAEFGELPRKSFDNPLVDSTLADNYWLNISQNLYRNTVVTIKHRGFPELDTGDLIEVQLEDQGPMIAAYVIQNRWGFKNGVLSGSTKLRLLKAVG